MQSAKKAKIMRLENLALYGIIIQYLHAQYHPVIHSELQARYFKQFIVLVH